MSVRLLSLCNTLRAAALAMLVASAFPLAAGGARAAEGPPAPSAAAAAAPAPAAPQPSVAASAPVVADPGYKLGAGDKVRVIVFGQQELSGEFSVDGAGNLALPLIPSLPANGLTARELQDRIKDALDPDYVQNPNVAVEILTYRPFYIVGEVQKPGSYAYVNGMTVLNAVAVAGGFTPRAKTGSFYITRESDVSKDKIDATPTTKVLPGDVIAVRERWF
jgi:polysaccharide export outer membrane protein